MKEFFFTKLFHLIAYKNADWVICPCVIFQPKSNDYNTQIIFAFLRYRLSVYFHSGYFRKIDDEIKIGDWYVGWHSWKFDISYHVCGYDSANAELHISMFGWFSLFVLPWKSKKFPHGDCDEPTYGIMIHNKALWIHTGGDGNLGNKRKCFSWYLPFTYSVPCCRSQVLCTYLGNGTTKEVFVDVDKIEKTTSEYVPIYERKNVLIDGVSYTVVTDNYIYTDSYDGEKIPCVIWTEEREWRPKWLQWQNIIHHVSRTAAVQFSKEVGKEKGSWKGGVLGTGERMKAGESALDAIKRMEKERNF